MTVLFINTLYTPHHMGGAEVSVQLLSEALVKKGHRVYVISLGNKRQVKRVNGVVVIYLRSKNIYSLLSAGKKPTWKRMLWHAIDTCNPHYYYQLKNIIRRIKPDVVNTNNLQGFSVFTWKVLRRLNLPVIHTMRDYYILCHRTTLFKDGCNCDKLCFACQTSFNVKKGFTDLPDAYIGISHFIMTKHHELGVALDKPGYIVPNIVELPTAPPQKQYDANHIRIGFMGRVTVEKGIDYLFSELHRLPLSNYTLVLAGVYDEAYKKELLQTYQPAGEIIFLGKTDAGSFYSSVDLVVIPSVWWEPFGRVAIEAMAWNKPLCIAAQAGLLDLYEPECMWQFQMQQGSLAGVLEAILRRPEVLVEKAAACGRFTTKYTANVVTEQFLHIAAPLSHHIKKHEK